MSMRFSLCNEVIAGLSFRKQCEMAAKLGYDGLEVAPFTLSATPARITAAERRKFRQTAEQAGIVITGLHWLLTMPAGLSITSSDATVHGATIEHVRQMTELCADLGGTVLVHGSPQNRKLTDAETPEQARDNALQVFNAAASAAKAAGVTYCIEPLSPSLTDYINTIKEALEIIGMVGSPHLKTMIDTLAVWSGEAEDPQTLIRRHMPGGMLAHVHLNDTNQRGPGQGEHSFVPVLRALTDSGYDGVIGIEPFDYYPDGPTAAAFSIGYLKGLGEQKEMRK